MRNRIVFTVFASLLFSAASYAADFDRVVSHIERTTHLHHQYIPFVGLGRLVVNIGHPEGVHDFRLAVFDGDSRPFPAELSGSVEKMVGPGWTRLVASKSKSGDQSLIFAQPAGALVRLLVIALDNQDTVVIQVEVDPDKVAEFVAEQQKNHDE